MLRATHALGTQKEPTTSTPPEDEAAEARSSSAEQRPGPTSGTSWKEVEHLDSQDTSAAAVPAAEHTDSSDSDNREIRIKDLDTGREYSVRQVERVGSPKSIVVNAAA